jgi:hypothetical protein
LLAVHPDAIAFVAEDTTGTVPSIRQYPSVPRRITLAEVEAAFRPDCTSRKYKSLAMGVEMVVRKSSIDAVAEV